MFFYEDYYGSFRSIKAANLPALIASESASSTNDDNQKAILVEGELDTLLLRRFLLHLFSAMTGSNCIVYGLCQDFKSIVLFCYGSPE